METLAAAWGLIKDVIGFATGLLHDPQIAAVVASLLVGMAATEAVAHALPPTMEAWKADRLVRLIVFGLSMCCAFSLVPTLHGFVWSLFAGLAAPTLYSLGSRALYAWRPELKPGALQQCPPSGS